MGQVRRRQFLIAAGALLTSPLVTEGQGTVTQQRIAYLVSDSALPSPCVFDPPNAGWDAFLDGLRVLGYVQGQNIALECRSAESKYERLDALARELVRTKPAVIVAVLWQPGGFGDRTEKDMLKAAEVAARALAVC